MLTEQNGIQVDKFYPPTDWQYSFPEGYTRLEYLQSSGTQYIDTGVLGNFDTLQLKTKFEITGASLTTEYGICGSKDTTTNHNGTTLFINTSKYISSWSGGGTSWVTSVKAEYNQKYEVTLNFNGANGRDITINGTTTTNTTVANNERNTGYNFYIFSDGISHVQTMVGKIYYFQIRINNTIVRNLIPAKRNSDNKPGMYDLVNDVFYVNQGTGEFVMGPELYSNNSQIDIRQKNNINFVEKYKFNENNELIWANPNLYLEGDKNSHINTGFNVSSKTTFEMDFMHLKDNNGYLFGSGGSGNNSFTIYQYTNQSADRGTFIYIKGNSGTNNFAHRILSGNTVNIRTKVYSKITNSEYNIFGITPTSTRTAATTLPDNLNISSSYQPAYLFSNHYYSMNKYNGRIYYAKFWEDGVLIRHFVPVPAGLQIGDFTVPSNGMFDIVNQQFYGNQGTGSFKFGQTRDIKVISPEDNTITLLYGVKSDFSKYSLFGLLANVSSGTYDVYIDDILYATTTKNTQTDIDFSTLGSEYVSIGTCTTPESLVLHKIVIKPTTSGETLTRFRGIITSGATGNQNQGVLWTHFELENAINISIMCSEAVTNHHTWNRIVAVTAKNNKITFSAAPSQAFRSTPLKYIPILFANNVYGLSQTFQGTNALKRVQYMNAVNNITYYAFATIIAMEQINIKEVTGAITENVFFNSRALKILPKKEFIGANNTNTLTSATQLYPTKIDCSDSNTKTKLDMFGTSTYPMRGLRGLKVSNEAPFTGSSPQINVSYTGLDRDALVELFESMPYNVGYTQPEGSAVTITDGVASGFSTTDYLTTPAFTPGNKPWEIVCKFTTGSSIIQSGVITGLGSGDSIAPLYIQTDSKLYFFLSSNGTSWNIAQSKTILTVQPNTTYIIKLEFTGSAYNAYSFENNEWILKNTLTTPISIYGTIPLCIGNNRGTGQPFNGVIDLDETYIKIKENNEWIPWFTGKAATTKQINITAATGNNLTKVGTGVTIDENGVASGFSSSDYLQLPGFNITNKYEIKTKFILNALPVSGEQNIIGTSNTYSQAGFIINSSRIQAGIRYTYNGSTARHNSNISMNWETNKIYYAKAILKDNTYQLFVSTDDIYWIEGNIVIIPTGAIIQNPNTGSSNSGALRIGGGTQYPSIDGSIDLENTYIKVDQNYIMKGYLTDNDRLIATNKGWGITG